MADTEVSSQMETLNMNGDVDSETRSDTSVEIDENWGLSRSEVYKIALKFYKEKEGKAIHASYKDKLKLVALTKQVHFGEYRPGVSPDVGFLDVVGNDRVKVWQSLGDMQKDAAQSEFVRILDELCPLFKPSVEAHKREKEEQERLRREEEERVRREQEEEERRRLEAEVEQRQAAEQNKQLQQELQIRAALNQQTAVQFKQYAEQQYPGNAQQQEELIKQLQEQHFQQYMQQVYQQQLMHQQQQLQQLNNMNQGGPQSQALPVVPGQVATVIPSAVATHPGNGVTTPATLLDNHQPHATQNGGQEGEEVTDGSLPIAAPSMWTRKDIKEFKDSLRKDTDSIIKVGSGETVTVRVPTHEDGTCLFWEFATDSYDLGFGVYFEWTVAPSNQVSVHVSESSDEEDVEEEEGGGGAADPGKGDVEKGGDSSSSKKDENRPPTDEIIPVYRRDCQDEVYCGSHMYPGRGVYLLKFDNSYSLWRSKTLYYRVYYTR